MDQAAVPGILEIPSMRAAVAEKLRSGRFRFVLYAGIAALGAFFGPAPVRAQQAPGPDPSTLPQVQVAGNPFFTLDTASQKLMVPYKIARHPTHGKLIFVAGWKPPLKI